MKHQLKRLRAAEDGFTLIELLIAIVVVGILTAVVIVGVSSLTDSGETAACQASRDAAQAAAAVYFANNDTWPATFTAMTTGANPTLQSPNGVTITDATMSNGTSWTVTIGGGGATATTFTACA